MYKKFCKDSLYFFKYNLVAAGIVGLLNCILVFTIPPDGSSLLYCLPGLLLMTSTELKKVLVATGYLLLVALFKFQVSPIYFLLFLPALLLVFPLTAWIHSPSHGSLRPRWLNRPMGELMGLVQMTGFPEWTVVHIFHHLHSDDAHLDPHAPGNKTYWQFAFGMRKQIGQCFMSHFFRIFGQNKNTIRDVKLFLIASKLTMFMKISFWYLILGPKLFSFFFVPSILFKMLHYAWFNYVTHQKNQEGLYEIFNHNKNFYRSINFIAAGLYFHGNHHKRPSLHNPKKMKLAKLKPSTKKAS